MSHREKAYEDWVSTAKEVAPRECFYAGWTAALAAVQADHDAMPKLGDEHPTSKA